MVGVDFGAKPAISLVVPRKERRTPEVFVGKEYLCCLYPATAPAEDFPDEIEFWGDEAYISTLPLIGDGEYDDIATANVIALPEDGIWECTTGYGDFATDNGCLIGGVTANGDRFDFRDTFPNTLTITVPDADTTYEVTRPAVTWETRYEPRCTWTGDGFTLRYNAVDFLWHLSGTAFIDSEPLGISETKTPPQNRPDGDYGTGGITVA